MHRPLLTPILLALAMAAGCTNPPDLGDPCTTDDDCAPDYVCHLEPGDDEGVCDTCRHDDPDCDDHDRDDDTGATGM
jgi:hypothetical protein